MLNVKVNQVYVAPLMAGRILRRIRILAPHPDGGFIIKVIFPNDIDIQRITNLGLDKAYRLERDVCEHKHTEDAYVDNGEFSPAIPNYYRCTDCGDLFPNTGDTALWFPKQLEVVEHG